MRFATYMPLTAVTLLPRRGRAMLLLAAAVLQLIFAAQVTAAAPSRSTQNKTKTVNTTAAIATPTTPAAAAAAATARPLLPLGNGDVVNVQVYGRPELNTTTYVADDGTIAVPLAGAVPVTGLSPTAAAQKIAAAYKSGQYLKNPQVTMMVTQARSQLISILGEVRSPGRFPVESRTTILDVLAQAGGTTERGGNVLYLMRPNESGDVERHTFDLRGINDHRYSLKVMTLQGGDSVVVPPAEQFYIYGEVHSPNMYRIEPDMTVLQAISRSGGLTKAASSNRVEIKRREAGGEVLTRKANLSERIQADDIIYVKESLF